MKAAAGLVSAARTSCANQILVVRPSAVALGKRREFSTSPAHHRGALPPKGTFPVSPAQFSVLQHEGIEAYSRSRSHVTDAVDESLLYERPKFGPSAFIAIEYLEQLYSVLTPPPLTALAALAERIPRARLTAEHTSQVELCCICPTFWEGVEDSMPLPTDRKQGFTHFWDETRASNAELAALGESMIELFVAEWLDAKYPHLPERITRDTIESYTGDIVCADISGRWGVRAGTTSAPRPPTAAERRLRQGNTEGQGLLRWQRKLDTEIDEKSGKPGVVAAYLRSMASVSRAVVGLVFQEHGYEQARQFVHAHWVSRQLQLSPLMKWRHPDAVLRETLNKYSMPPLELRLLKEAGRDSASPVYVVGAFSGDQKLGEGWGSSFKMAQFRCAENALCRIYLVGNGLIDDEGIPDVHRHLPLPSDVLMPDAPPYVPQNVFFGDDEVEYGRASPFALSPQEERASPFRNSGKPPAKIHHGPKRPQGLAERRPKRPTSGPGSKDPSLPLEHRMPRSMFERNAGGPNMRREKGNDRPVREMPREREDQPSAFANPFARENLRTWSRAEAEQIQQANDYR